MSDQNESYILAIDLGTSAAKVALISVFGEVLGWESEEVPLQILPNGGAEQDPLDWWGAIMRTSKRLLGHGLVPAERIVAVCAATHGAGTIPVDRDGTPLMNAMIWLDSRGADLSKKFVAGAINVEGYGLLKLLRYIRITGGAPSHSGKDLVGHVLYLREAFPEIYDKTYKFLDVVDYVDFRLTGNFVATNDTKAISWVTDNRDPEQVCYHDGLIRDLGLEREKLPPLHRSIDVIGDLLPEVAAELGLPQGVKVVAGAYDLPAAAVGSGAVEDYQAHLTLATSSFLTVHVPFKKTDLMNGIASLPCAIPNRYLVLAEQEAAGVNLTFMRDNLLFHSDALLDMRTPADFFEALNRVAESAPPGSNGLIYTPWIYGERAPVDDPFIRAGLHNISLHNTRADLARAIFEGVALNTRWVLDPVERFCARRLETIHVVGGGANSDLWCQILADVLNRTICQVRNPIQAAARGAAFIAAVGLGFLQFSEIPKYIHFQNEFHPNPDNGHLYDELFEAFVNLYKSNKDIYRHLNRAKRNAT